METPFKAQKVHEIVPGSLKDFYRALATTIRGFVPGDRKLSHFEAVMLGKNN